MGISDSEYVEKLMANLISKNKINSAVIRVESGDGRFSWTSATGDMNTGSRYFLSSVTKFYLTAVVIQMIEEDLIRLEDKAADYLPHEYAQGLHVYKGVDYSSLITIKNLLSNTSGLADYFFHRKNNGKSKAKKLLESNDELWNLDKTFHLIRKMNPKFPPGKKGKASYSDTNFQLLGKIIEIVKEKRIDKVFQEYIFDPLKLKDTYVYSDSDDQTPVPFYYKSEKLWLPEYMTSVPAEGGIISTAEECMLFLKAFFQGYFFPIETVSGLKKWNLILPPQGFFLFGIGLEKMWTPWILSPFKPISDIMGFRGQTGSFAWYNPDTDLYFCGTTNQIDSTGHAAAEKVLLKMIKKAW